MESLVFAVTFSDEPNL